MNKNNIIGFLLIAVVLIGFSWYNQPSAEEQRAAFVQDSIAKAKHAEMEKASKAAAAKRQTDAKAKVEADSTALFYSALKGQAKKIVLKNKKVELTLNTKGATVEKAVIKGYVGHNLQVKDGSADAKDVTLFEGNDQSLKFMLEAKEANIITSDLYFTPSNVTDKSVTMTAVAGEGKTLTLTYTLGDDYMLHMSLQANGMAGLFSPNYNKMDVDWSDKARQQELEALVVTLEEGYVLGIRNPLLVELVDMFRRPALIPFSFVHAHHLSALHADAAIRQEVRRIGEDHVELEIKFAHQPYAFTL